MLANLAYESYNQRTDFFFDKQKSELSASNSIKDNLMKTTRRASAISSSSTRFSAKLLKFQWAKIEFFKLCQSQSEIRIKTERDPIVYQLDINSKHFPNPKNSSINDKLTKQTSFKFEIKWESSQTLPCVRIALPETTKWSGFYPKISLDWLACRPSRSPSSVYWTLLTRYVFESRERFA